MSIRQRLLRIEDDFLSAITKGSDSVELFHEQLWTPLTQEIESAIQSSSLDDNTTSLAHATAARIAILAGTFHDLCVDSEKLTSDIMYELDTIASELTLDDPSSYSLSLREPSPSGAKRTIISSADERISTSYRVINYDTSDSHLSPTPSLVSLSTADDSDEGTEPTPVAGRKRSRSFLEDTEDRKPHSDGAVKRLRVSNFCYETEDLENESWVTSRWLVDPLLPSNLTLTALHDNELVPSYANALLDQKPNVGYSSRKRRLSEAEPHAAPKRPRGLSIGARPHVVSDPFPVGSAPLSMQCLDDLFQIPLGTPDISSQSISVVESLTPVQIDFFDAWPSISPIPGGSQLAQTINTISDIAQPVNINHGLRSPITIPDQPTSPSCSASNFGASPCVAAEMLVPSPHALSGRLPISSKAMGISANNLRSALSKDDGVRLPALGIVSSELSPLSHQDSLPDISSTESTEPDVISLFTTLYDADPASIPVADSIPQLTSALPIASPASSEAVGDENWANFLASLVQPPEVVLPSPPAPYDPSSDFARLLESLLQPGEVVSVPTAESTGTQVLSEKQKELEAARKAVRRLEAEVGIAA